MIRFFLLLPILLFLAGCQLTGDAPSTEEAVSQSTDDATSAEDVLSQSTDDASRSPEGWVRLSFDLDEKGTPQNIYPNYLKILAFSVRIKGFRQGKLEKAWLFSRRYNLTQYKSF